MTISVENQLVEVATYNDGGLAILNNQYCFQSITNKKLENFQDKVGNLGTATLYDVPPPGGSADGLVVTAQPLVQLQEKLVCDHAANATFNYNALEDIFNIGGVHNYMGKFGRKYAAELAARIEIDLAKHCNSSSVSQIDGDDNLQNIHSGPTRFAGNGTTPLTSFEQLNQANVLFDDIGSVKTEKVCVLPNTITSKIVGTGLNQFALTRNNEIANSWDLGTWGSPATRYMTSNLLPTQVAGNVGANSTELTLVSTNDSTGQNVTAITFSGATASDVDAINKGDLGRFIHVDGKPDLFLLTDTGHAVSSSPVQFRAVADAAADGSGIVTISIWPALRWVGIQQNINTALVAGMKIRMTPSHKCGVIISDNAFFMSMPRLPNEDPYTTYAQTDKDTGLSLRIYYGAKLGENKKIFVHDAVWGASLNYRNCLRMVIPLSQATLGDF